jgi:hypothetical protein
MRQLRVVEEAKAKAKAKAKNPPEDVVSPFFLRRLMKA